MLQKHAIQCGIITLALLLSLLLSTEYWNNIVTYIANNHYITNLDSDYFSGTPSDTQLALRIILMPLMLGATVTIATLMLARSAESIAGLHWKKFTNKPTNKANINDTASNLFLLCKTQKVAIYIMGLIATGISSPLTPLYELNQAVQLIALLIILAGHICTSRKYLLSLIDSLENDSQKTRFRNILFDHSETQFHFEGDVLFIIEYKNPHDTNPIKKLAIIDHEKITPINR